MKLLHLALATLAAISFNANAELVRFTPLETAWPSLTGVEMRVVTAANGARVAMGAHAYTNGVTMPNNGVDTYYGMGGLKTPTRANWSFDYAWDFAQCADCSVQLFVDTDPGAGTAMVNLPITGIDSWNMEMTFMDAALGYNFDPFSPSSTLFSLRMFDGAAEIARSEITVNVPEPGSMALLALGLAGMGAMLRRRSKR